MVVSTAQAPTGGVSRCRRNKEMFCLSGYGRRRRTRLKCRCRVKKFMRKVSGTMGKDVVVSLESQSRIVDPL
jgi:hypothetical protein